MNTHVRTSDQVRSARAGGARRYAHGVSGAGDETRANAAGRTVPAPGRDPRRRRALLEAADRIILREGPDVSMASIAAEAGISKPILYRHFGDKSGLYQALADRHVRVLVDTVRTAFLRPGEMRARSRAAIDTYLASIAANRHLYGFLVHRAGAEDTATHSAMSTLIRGLGGEIAEILLAEGRVPDPVRAHVWAHATVGMVQAAGEWWLDNPGVPRGVVVDSIAELILDGLPAAGRR
jgi:AcrR family transcriptional regulator